MTNELSQQLSFNFDAVPSLLTPTELYEKFTHTDTILRFKEDRRIEIKSSRYDLRQLANYFSMWANTPDGGLIIVGIEDDGTITGCHEMGDERLNKLEAVGRHHCPDARYISKRIPATLKNGDQSFAVVFKVDYHESKVVKRPNGDAFARVADMMVALTDDEVNILSIDKGERPFESEAVVMQYPEDFDTASIHSFAESFRELRNAPELSDVKILELRRLGKSDGGAFKPNNACALLFAKDPLELFPGCKVRFLRYQGEIEHTGEQYNVIKDVQIEGSVPTLIREASRVIDEQLRTFSKLERDGHFHTVPEYPRPAWLEALINACVHRSYAMKNMNIFVRMFDDHFEIESPGGFLPPVNPTNIYEQHNPRNPRLMNALFFLGLVREHNEGTKRMLATMTEQQLPPPIFEQVSGGTGYVTVRVILRNNQKQRKSWVDTDATAILGELLASKLDENARLVVNYVSVNGSINVTQCQQSVPACSRWHASKKLLDRLVLLGVLIHHHSKTNERDPNACYTFIGVPQPVKVHWREQRKLAGTNP